MAKKFVRGITDIKTINNQDFDTNNVNDLLSDGEHNYIHRKKGKTEEYHNLTDNIKTISSDNTELLAVTNNNKTTNTATLHPKHDAQKEQVLESTRGTITINHGANGTTETTKVDTNPEKVLEHDNLLTNYGISKTKSGNTTKLGLEYKHVDGARFDLNNFDNGKVRASDFVNAPSTGWLFVSAYSEGNYTIQRAIKLVDTVNTTYVRASAAGVWGPWREQVGDKSIIDGLLAQKQNTITNNTSIGVSGTGLRQLYASPSVYTGTRGTLKTHIKYISNTTSIENVQEEFNFIVKITKGVDDATFILNSNDTTKFNNIMTTYGQNNTVRISGCVFTLSGSILTVSTANNTEQNYIITFSYII